MKLPSQARQRAAAGRARQALAREDGYPVVIRGLEAGSPVQREIRVKSIRRALDAETDWPELVALFAEQADFVVSNSTESGLVGAFSLRKLTGRG